MHSIILSTEQSELFIQNKYDYSRRRMDRKSSSSTITSELFTLSSIIKISLFILTFVVSSQQSCQSFVIKKADFFSPPRHRNGFAQERRRHRITGNYDPSRAAISIASNTDSHDTTNNTYETFKPNDNARAGRDGYSLMRQPLQRDSWDSSSDPSFRTPKSFVDDEEKNGNKQNNNWWSSKQQRRGDGLLLASSKTSILPASTETGPSSSSSSSSSSSLPPSSSTSAFEEQELDLFQRSVDTLDFPMILGALRRECFTLPARQMVDEAAVQTHHLPQQDQDQEVQSLIANNPHEARKRYKAVLEMQHLLSTETTTANLRSAYYKNRHGIQVTIGQGNPPPLEGLSFDIESILKIISEDGEVLEGPDILEISTMINAMEDLQLWSRGLERIIDDVATSEMTDSRREGEENLSSSPSSSALFVEIPHIVDGIKLNTTLQNLLEEAFDDEGKLSGKTFPFLGQLRAKVRTMKADILQTLDSIVQLPSIKSKLALESGGPLISEVASSNGAGRLVLPINPKYASALGIVHDSSRSGKTVYVEPSEIVGPTNDLRVVERDLEAEEARVWRLLTEQVWNNQRDLRASVQAVAQLDLCVARYTLGQRLEGVIPDVQDEGIISLRNAKHPVLLLRKMEKVVGSDISLGVDGKQGLVLTGPNSGGKTLILKLLGLLALMSRSGIPIPAEHGDMDGVYLPRVDFFDPVLADIGDIQSVDSDLSTFSGHMYICREVLALTKGGNGKNSLVLMDELGSGTDPNQGVAIAQALLEALLDTGCRVVITTHYMALKQLASSDDRFSVGGMQFVGGRPTYKLLPGVVGESYALAVAERLQLPQTVLDRASELLDSETRQMGDLISDLEDQKLLIDEQVVEIEERKKEIGAMEYIMKEKFIQMEKKMLTARRDEARKFAKKLEEKEQILEDILDKLKSDPSRKVITQSWESIKFVKRDAINEAENVPSVLKKKKNAAKAMKEAIEELVPLAEIRNRPLLNDGDKLQVCKPGNLFGREATVIKDAGKQVQVIVSGLSVKLKHTELSKVLTVDGIESKRTAASGRKSPGMSKSVEKALKSEAKGGNSSLQVGTKKASTSLAMRTDGNTVDVRGCNLEGALEEVTRKIGQCNLNGNRSVYILHGHGSGGVLKSRLRDWLKTEKRLIKKWAPADMSDGGDAFTRIEL